MSVSLSPTSTHMCFRVCTDITPSEVNLKLVILTLLKRLRFQYRLKDVDNLAKELFEMYKHSKHADLTDICRKVFRYHSNPSQIS